jgi:hypothetical protein
MNVLFRIYGVKSNISVRLLLLDEIELLQLCEMAIKVRLLGSLSNDHRR